MKPPKFELNKISRLIRTSGVEYTFNRAKLNEFREPTTEEVSTTTVKGVFHETTSHISVVSSDSSSVKSKQVPYILTLYDAAKGLAQNDYVFINGKKYIVTGLVNIGNWNIVVDISLEAVV